MYTQDFSPVSDSLGLTAIFAALPIPSLTFTFNWLPAAGTHMLISGVITMAVIGLSPGRALRAIGAAAVGLAGQEGDLFRKVLGVLVYLQSTAVLDWMVVK